MAGAEAPARIQQALLAQRAHLVPLGIQATMPVLRHLPIQPLRNLLMQARLMHPTRQMLAPIVKAVGMLEVEPKGMVGSHKAGR